MESGGYSLTHLEHLAAELLWLGARVSLELFLVLISVLVGCTVIGSTGEFDVRVQGPQSQLKCMNL